MAVTNEFRHLRANKKRVELFSALFLFHMLTFRFRYAVLPTHGAEFFQQSFWVILS